VDLTADQKHITIQNNVADHTAVGDEISIKEALVILIDNAIKYSPERTTVTLASKLQGKFIALSVSDQGQGIKATDMSHIFDRFYRADSSRTRGQVEGYGLGLSIAQKIAQAHHGSLEAKSTPGQGSTFTIKLPVAPAPTPPAPTAVPEANAAKSTGRDNDPDTAEKA
jgi:signal transduction histidine kinase